MNVLLKAMLKEVCDLVAVGKAASGKQWGQVFGTLIAAGEDVPAIVANWVDLKPELEALLVNPAADADLLAYAAGLVAGEEEKAKKVIVASVDLILTGSQKVGALLSALQA